MTVRRSPRAERQPDAELLRAAARRIAWQISAACAIVVVLVAVVALSVGQFRHSRPPRPGLRDDDWDDVLRETLIISAVVGIVIAGVVGFLVARRAVAPLGEALALQRRFVADAGHELRTPLTVLHTRAQLLARRMPADDPSRPAVDQLLDDSRVLGEIVDEMLESAALAADPGRGEPVDVDDIAREVVAAMDILADKADVSLEVEASSGRLVRASRSALRRAITALVDNALSHTPPGGRVVVASAADAGRVLISVTDNGEGLAGDDAAKLTERFARGQGSAGGVGGTRRFGLGLSLVREVAAAHGGALTLDEAQGGGVRAVIDLPTLTDMERL
ncbi:sensor histidine kinase [Nakamurella sp. GG22]